ncbi:MAG: histidine kinase [Acidimicrobiia bacterium]
MLAGLGAVVVIGVIGLGIARRSSTDQAVHNARDLTEADARNIAPLLTQGLLTGDVGDRRRLVAAIRSRVLSSRVVRVKVWTAAGRIVASDDPILVDRTFALPPEERAVLRAKGVNAEVSDLTRPENQHERRFGKLLEVYVGARTTDGTPLLFETYSRFDAINENGNRLLVSFAPALLGGLLLLWLVQLPLAVALVRRLRRSRDHEHALLARAIESSDRERRRIAADLHDSVVQDLAGASMSLAAIARRSDQAGDHQLAEDLETRARALRQSVRELRTLVVAIAPRRLHDEGLAIALEDLASSARARGLTTSVAVESTRVLDRTVEGLLFRGAQEGVRNILNHADASTIEIALTDRNGSVHLRVDDDGIGFDPAGSATAGHVGLRLLGELAADAGGTLTLSRRPTGGTTLTLEVPAP